MLELAKSDRPYPPSWLDHLTRWLRNLPASPALVYSGILVLTCLLALAGRAAAGVLPGASWTLREVYDTFSGPFLLTIVLAFNQYLDTELIDAVERSRPIYQGSQEEFADLKYRFAVIPPIPAIIVGALFAVLGGVAGLEWYGFEVPTLTNSVIFLDWSVTAGISFTFVLKVIHILLVMTRFYAGDLEVDLYNLTPVYELSNVAGKAGIFLVIWWYPNLPLNLDKPVQEDLFRVVIAAFVGLLPMAAFFIPIGLLNRRLSGEKSRLLGEVSGKLKDAFAQLESGFSDGHYDRVAGLESAISSFIKQKQYIEAIPTWPWRTGTFRVALTAVMLPVIVYIIQQVLERLLQF